MCGVSLRFITEVEGSQKREGGHLLAYLTKLCPDGSVARWGEVLPNLRSRGARRQQTCTPETRHTHTHTHTHMHTCTHACMHAQLAKSYLTVKHLGLPPWVIPVRLPQICSYFGTKRQHNGTILTQNAPLQFYISTASRARAVLHHGHRRAPRKDGLPSPDDTGHIHIREVFHLADP